MYIHICKRKMECLEKKYIKDSKKMYIVPGKIIVDNGNPIRKDELFRYKSGNKLYPLQWKMNRLKVQLKMYSVKKILERNKRAKQIKCLKENLLSRK